MTPDVLAYVRACLPAPPARVLEVGAGDGSLAGALRSAGYDVVAIDPGGDGEGVRAVALIELDEPEASFDAAVAIVSLHHVEPLEESCARLARLVRPGGVLIVDELDLDRLDSRATEWRAAQLRFAGTEDAHDPDQVLEMMRAHIHPLRAVCAALDSAGFAVGEPVRGTYLYRWHVPVETRALEERLVGEGRLPAVGARMVGIRRRS
jgi:2-polyprenyl-3-methyl-5-hydroxy-6-metoxy-1,4-benzoquinol methylase